ncbi:ABC transporter ATP-binding protein [Burkholderia cepacia]|uniref:ABC transporter ATP-binding protein n=1 Tax=Burkholderia cepacia TaxID=292 RepID=UPI00299F5A4C|nr:ABC transporter ATP-binding protein [Burkholderia cepacia]
MNTQPLMEAEGLVKRYVSSRGIFRHGHVVHAVNGVSLAVGQHEAVGLVGESGSGKSTTGRLLLGIEKADAGTVKFDGACLPAPGSAAWRRQRAQMQMVFQNPLAALDRRLAVRRQIEEPMIIHGLADVRDRVSALLDAVGLRPDHADRLPASLSGGQRQRVVLARALATDPDLIVCDEPISALDVSIQAQILNLLSDLRQSRGTAILFISHDLRAVRQISDRIAVMYLGTIVEEGPTDAVLEDPQHPYTQALVSAAPTHEGLKKNRIVLQGEPPNPADRPDGCAFHPRCPTARDACRQIAPVLAPFATDAARRVACHLVPVSTSATEAR